MTADDLAEILRRLERIDARIGSVELALAEARGADLKTRVDGLEDRVHRLELWVPGSWPSRHSLPPASWWRW